MVSLIVIIDGLWLKVNEFVHLTHVRRVHVLPFRDRRLKSDVGFYSATELRSSGFCDCEHSFGSVIGDQLYRR